MGQHIQAVTELDRATPSLSHVESNILGVLEGGPANGATLCERLSMSPGTIYTTLYRMVAKGFLVSEQESRRGGRPLRFYSLTQRGQRMLRSSKAIARELDDADYDRNHPAPIWLPPER